VPLDELLDSIDRTARTADGRSAREQVVVRHPLQPFSARNFTGGALGVPRPFSFDRAALAGAAAAAGPHAQVRPFLPGPLPPLADDGTVRLDDLRKFLDHPNRAFLRQRLHITFFTDDEDPADGLPVELHPLEQWAVGDRLLRANLAGADLTRCIAAEWRRGTVPPGNLGKRVLDTVADEITPLVAAAGPHLTGEPTVVDVVATVPGRRPLTGTVGDVYGDTLATVTYSKLGPKHRLRAWVHLLALTTAHPGRRWRAVSIGRGDRRRDGGRPRRSTLGPVDPATAAAALATLIQLHDEGMREPLPLALKASHAYACCRTRGGSPDQAVALTRQEWTRFGGGGESDDPAHTLVWGGAAPLDVLLTEPATGAGTTTGEPSRFGALAMRLWVPLLDAETVDRV
jgi:exodeoxyribonuclease V gamma subunit